MIKIKGKTYKPIGNELGYCIGGSFFKKRVFYFKGYPQRPYEECEIIELDYADPKSFESDTVMGEGRDKNNKYFQGKIVEKGNGIELNQDWEFVPFKGIKCQSVELFFNTERSLIRDLLGNEEEFNFTRAENEDSYHDFQNTDTWIRLIYDESNLLNEIEFLGGTLRVGEIVIFGNHQDVFQLKEQLEDMEYNVVRKDEEYWMDANKKITFSSSADMGGEGDEVVYFYTANDMGHLIDE